VTSEAFQLVGMSPPCVPDAQEMSGFCGIEKPAAGRGTTVQK
jgi:hypothetical protein